MECYNVSVVSGTCLIKLINSDVATVKTFLGTEIIDYIDVLDEDEKILTSYDIYAKRKQVVFEETTIQEEEKRVISEAYTEKIPAVKDEETGEIITPEQEIFHPEQTETIYKDVQVEMITAIMEKAGVHEEINNIKQVVGIQNTNNMTLDEFKTYYVNLSKLALQTYLVEHPLVSDCHNQTKGTYSITEEKQTLMMANYITYTINKQISPDTAVLTWNESGEVCEVWQEAEYLQLVSEIESIVKPLVSQQQTFEKQIMDCNSVNAVKEIVLDYASYDIRNQSTEADE